MSFTVMLVTFFPPVAAYLTYRQMGAWPALGVYALAWTSMLGLTA